MTFEEIRHIIWRNMRNTLKFREEFKNITEIDEYSDVFKYISDLDWLVISLDIEQEYDIDFVVSKHKLKTIQDIIEETKNA